MIAIDPANAPFPNFCVTDRYRYNAASPVNGMIRNMHYEGAIATNAPAARIGLVWHAPRPARDAYECIEFAIDNFARRAFWASKARPVSRANESEQEWRH